MLTRGVGHTLADSVLYPSLMIFFFLLFMVFLMIYALPLQVQGDADDVVESLRLVLNQLAAAAVVAAEYPAAEEDEDDDVDPADYPGLFSDDVSCLMLL